MELVKSSIQGMFMHSMVVYDWLISLHQNMERVMKRFIWSGDISKSKFIMVGWNNICLPFKEGVWVLGLFAS